MNTPEIVAQGGFNTGRLYTPEGQLIFWTVYSDRWVVMRDRSRMTECWFINEIALDPVTRVVDPKFAMAIYDSAMVDNERQIWFHYGPDERRNDSANRAPKDFDYGPALNI